MVITSFKKPRNFPYYFILWKGNTHEESKRILSVKKNVLVNGCKKNDTKKPCFISWKKKHKKGIFVKICGIFVVDT
jgi:hypothetical protein